MKIVKKNTCTMKQTNKQTNKQKIQKTAQKTLTTKKRKNKQKQHETLSIGVNDRQIVFPLKVTVDNNVKYTVERNQLIIVAKYQKTCNYGLF